MDNDIKILDEIYSQPENFLSRVNQELKRAQRYLNFVSYINIDTNRMNVTDNLPVNGQNLELFNKLRLHIRKTIRQTDIISGFVNGKISLLLIETNKTGAEIVKKRLQDSIKYFLHEIVEAPQNWKINLNAGSFPDDEHTPNSFYDKLNSSLS